MPLRTEITRTEASFSIGQSVVFFGNETLATGVVSEAVLLRSLLAYGHTVECIVLSGKMDPKRPLSVERVAQEFDIDVHWVQSKPQLETLAADCMSEVAVLASFGMIVPQPVIDQFNFGIINVHPSLLPNYRGSTPLEQTILDGLTETGYSIMLLNAQMDEGPLFVQEPLPVPVGITKQALHDLLVAAAAERLPETISQIVSGSLSSYPQVGKPSYTARLVKADGHIDWSKPAPQLEREIRAYSGWPKSYTTLQDIAVVVLEAEVIDDSTLAPGAIDTSDKQLVMGCGQNSALRVMSLQPQGKKPMDAQSFMNGYLSRS